MKEDENATLFRQKLELLLITQSSEVLERTKSFIINFELSFFHISKVNFSEAIDSSFRRVELVLLSQDNGESIDDLLVRTQKMSKIFPRSFFIIVLGKDFNRSLVGPQFPKVFPLTHFEFYNSLKLEYLGLYCCRSQYIEFDVGELFPMTTLTFSVFIWLNKNQRYLAAAFKNMILSESRHQRLLNRKSVFIYIGHAQDYLDYVKLYFDMSGKALKKRARALFLCICNLSFSLNEIVLFECKNTNPNNLEKIFDQIKQTATELFEVMKQNDSLWDVFREGLKNEFVPFCRAPWIATYATLMSVRSGLGNPMNTFLVGLLADVGLYDLDREIVASYLLSDSKDVPEQQMDNFRRHPILSLNRCLSKKLPIDENIKSILVCTHEQFDEKGFPNEVPAEHLPVEAQLLRFAEMIDQGDLIIKNTGMAFRVYREKIWEEEKKSNKFSPEFLTQIADTLI